MMALWPQRRPQEGKGLPPATVFGLTATGGNFIVIQLASRQFFFSSFFFPSTQTKRETFFSFPRGAILFPHLWEKKKKAHRGGEEREEIWNNHTENREKPQRCRNWNWSQAHTHSFPQGPMQFVRGKEKEQEWQQPFSLTQVFCSLSPFLAAFSFQVRWNIGMDWRRTAGAVRTMDVFSSFLFPSKREKKLREDTCSDTKKILSPLPPRMEKKMPVRFHFLFSTREWPPVMPFLAWLGGKNTFLPLSPFFAIFLTSWLGLKADVPKRLFSLFL